MDLGDAIDDVANVMKGANSVRKLVEVSANIATDSSSGPGIGILVGVPISGIILLIACCYCMYRCCCCCCRRDKQVVVVNTTNMVQQPTNTAPPSVTIVNQMPPERIEFDNPIYNSQAVPLLPTEMVPASEWSPKKY